MSKVNSAEKAIRLVARDLQRAVACVVAEQLAVDRAADAPKTSTTQITFFGRSGRAKLSNGNWISIAMEFRPAHERSKSKSWRTHTATYTFAIFGTESGRTEMLSYHYHPDVGVRWPHLHVNAKADWVGKRSLRKRHLATGRLTLEDFVEFLITDFGAKPTTSQWKSALRKNRDTFSERRTWG